MVTGSEGRNQPPIKAVLFDFGGVLAEEGFQKGLMAIAEHNGFEPQRFFETATEIIYACGYVTGTATEGDFWELLRQQTALSGTDQALTKEILDRFILRPQMLASVKNLRKNGYFTAILSDQSDWLDRLNRQYNFFPLFDAVFNSYHLGKSKRDPSLLRDIITRINIPAPECLFVDDNPGHIERAKSLGLATHLMRSQEQFFAALNKMGIL